jgi:LysM repeat protein
MRRGSKEPLDASQAIAVDTRLYDGASREVRSGPAGTLPAGYVQALVGNNSDLSGATTTTSLYDAAGRLQRQHVDNEANASADTDTQFLRYDGAGNVLQYRTTSGGTTTTYTTQLLNADGYKQWKITGDDGNGHVAVDTSSYDANGNLVAIDDSNGTNDDRTFVNDAQGHVLRKTQEGNALNELVVDGNVIARFGVGTDPNDPGNTGYVKQADFDLAYVPVTNSYPNATTGQYPVQAGDTLESIAQSAYGDSSLWYLIADESRHVAVGMTHPDGAFADRDVGSPGAGLAFRDPGVGIRHPHARHRRPRRRHRAPRARRIPAAAAGVAEPDAGVAHPDAGLGGPAVGMHDPATPDRRSRPRGAGMRGRGPRMRCRSPRIRRRGREPERRRRRIRGPRPLGIVSVSGS